MALLVLTVISLVSVTLLISVNVNTKIGSHGKMEMQALEIAEAGVAEAVSRIRTGDIPVSTNPRQVAQVFNTLSGTVPVLGVDSIGLATRQPVNEWLGYTTPGRSSKTLTVRYKTDAARTVIYRYDPDKNPAVQTATGVPIFVVSSTGTQGKASRQIVTEVIQRPVNFSAMGALVADQGIDFSGNSDVCGYDHNIDTPAGTKGRPPCSNYEVGSGNLAGGWSTGTITSGGSSVQNGTPAILPNQTGFPTGPWAAFGMGQSEFFAWVGSPLASEPGSPQGIYYLDDNGTTQDASGNFAYHGGTGDGLLYVDGDLTINGNFVFRGLIYIEGNLKINGTCWILGSVMVKGKTRIKIANGNCCILYSSDAITQNIAKYGGRFVTLSWREAN
jgi:hypothetical protein